MPSLGMQDWHARCRFLAARDVARHGLQQREHCHTCALQRMLAGRLFRLAPLLLFLVAGVWFAAVASQGLMGAEPLQA
jgi:hypothetical protein